MSFAKLVFLTPLPVALTACMASEPAAPLVDMANPASVHCGSLGGETVIQDGPDGQTGYCRMPNGQLVDEWALYRSSLND
ncbi:MAG: DUF333 domain-containing protein [Pseudomonadota bacterium]|nr:DUF333 domain-containing protein [Pseudomonadota bacterium]